jgi:hypothetical protein
MPRLSISPLAIMPLGRWFQVCGSIGLVAALAAGALLARVRDLLQGVVVALGLAAILVFLALAMATKIVSGEERLIYDEIAVVACSALLLRLAGLPVLPYLDILVIGLGLFLACGRPWRYGIRYSRVHVKAGFPRYLAGVRIFPVQALESAAVFILTAAAAWILISRGHS